MNIEVKRSLTGGTQKAYSPQNIYEILSILLNKAHYVQAKRTDLNKALSEALLEQPVALFFDLYSKRRKELKSLYKLHLKTHKGRYCTPFSEDLLQKEHKFWVPDRLPNASFIKKQLKKVGVKRVTSINKGATHTFFFPGVKYIEGVVYTDIEEMFQFFNQETELTAVKENHVEKITTLLLAGNDKSRDLGLNLLKELDVIDKELLIPLFTTYITKFQEGSKFKQKTGWVLVQRAFDYHLSATHLKKFNKATKDHKRRNYVMDLAYHSLNILLNAGLDVSLLFDFMLHNQRSYNQFLSTNDNVLHVNNHYLVHYVRNLHTLQEPLKYYNATKPITEMYITGYSLEHPDLKKLIDALPIEELTLIDGDSSAYGSVYNAALKKQKLIGRKLADFQPATIYDEGDLSKIKKVYCNFLSRTDQVKDIHLHPDIKNLNILFAHHPKDKDFSEVLNQLFRPLKKLKTITIGAIIKETISLNLTTILKDTNIQRMTINLINITDDKPITHPLTRIKINTCSYHNGVLNKVDDLKVLNEKLEE